MTSAARACASLSPDLLARKGQARPAMRSGFAKAVGDLGWNDSGEDGPFISVPRDQQAQLEQLFAPPFEPLTNDGPKIAFTLRLGPDHHLRLRLASAVTNRSAQQLLVEALEAMLGAMPQIEHLAEQVPKPKRRAAGEGR